jgi:hypothetical protein
MGGMAKRKTPKHVKAKPSKLRSRPKKRVARSARSAKASSAKSRNVAKRVTKRAAKKGAKKAATAKVRKPSLAKTTVRAETGLRRRDGSGHLDPKYAADLRQRSGRTETAGVGFLERSRSSDDLAEALGEQFVEGATTGEGAAEDLLDQEVPEERGGPFVQSSAGTEFAEGTDRSNPKGAKREPFPTT